MANTHEHVNLEKIKEIPKDEFKKHLEDWMEDKEISKVLQTKLRKDLIETFNRTSLGRKISSQFQVNQGFVLSPLILGLNTLVAEFLYVQNCHFSLSVFSSEVPYKNTLPDFEKMALFHFNRDEIMEIFEALGINDEEMRERIVSYYAAIDTKRNYSLLHCIIKECIKRVMSKNGNEEKRADPKWNKQEPLDNSAIPVKTITDLNEIQHIGKYLNALSKRVKQMSMELYQLRKKKCSRIERKAKKAEKLKILNKSLKNITNIEMLKLSCRKEKRCSAVVKTINNLTKRLEKCAENFDKLSQEITKSYLEISDNRASINTDTEKKLKASSYSEWVKDLKNSKNGQKFISKLENSLCDTMDKEKSKLEKIFEEKLENQKLIWKLHYKQKFLEHFRAMNLSTESREKTSDMPQIEIPASTGASVKYDEIRTDKKVQIKKPAPVLTSCTSATINICPSAPISNSKNNFTAKKSQSTSHTKNIVQIVEDAKNRIQVLEKESEKLDKSFQDYLQKQNNEKQKVHKDVSQIWQNYNFGKTVLNHKIKQTAHTEGFSGAKYKPEKYPRSNTDYLCPMTIEINDSPSIELSYKNPFKNFKLDTFVSSKKPKGIRDICKIDNKISFISNNNMKNQEELESVTKPVDKEKQPKINIESIGKPNDVDNKKIASDYQTQNTCNVVNVDKSLTGLTTLKMVSNDENTTSNKDKISNNSIKKIMENIPEPTEGTEIIKIDESLLFFDSDDSEKLSVKDKTISSNEDWN